MIMTDFHNFATIHVYKSAVRYALPGNRGPEFYWGDTFPQAALEEVHKLWRAYAVIDEVSFCEESGNKNFTLELAKKVAREFQKITHQP